MGFRWTWGSANQLFTRIVMVEKAGNPQPLGNICLQFLHIYGSLVQANIPQLAAGG